MTSSVNSTQYGINIGRGRQHSSTRFDFLDLDNNYLSVGSSSAFTGMSDTEGNKDKSRDCGCDPSEVSGCEKCTSGG